MIDGTGEIGVGQRGEPLDIPAPERGEFVEQRCDAAVAIAAFDEACRGIDRADERTIFVDDAADALGEHAGLGIDEMGEGVASRPAVVDRVQNVGSRERGEERPQDVGRRTQDGERSRIEAHVGLPVTTVQARCRRW